MSHGIEDEPHFRRDAHPSSRRDDNTDAGERAAEELLRHESLRSRDARQRAEQSVFEEPFAVTSHNDGSRPTEIDATCGACGYPLRGLTTGDACPECGYREARTYGEWLAAMRAKRTASQAWLMTLLAAVVGGPLAVALVFASMWADYGLAAIVLFGPVAEEVLKVGAVMMIVETRPYLFTARSQIVVAALASALGFATIENLLYLNVYISDPSPMLIAWRWTICTALHVGCTAIATLGVVRVWQRTVTQGRSPDLVPALRWLVLAIVVHGAYNAMSVVLPFAGFYF